MRRDFQGKNQHKYDSKLHKHYDRGRLRHSDEVIRVNQEKMRKLEREQREGNAPILVGREEKWRYGMLVGVCVVVIIACMFYMLNRKAEVEGMGL